MDPYLGTILPFAFNFAPRGWLMCQGQTMQITQNQALYALLGIVYGGDGRVNFMLPDLRGRAIISQGVSAGTGTYPMGTKAGAETVVMTTANLPVHTHPAAVTAGAATPITATLNAAAGVYTVSNPTGALLASSHGSALTNGGYAMAGTATQPMAAGAITFNPGTNGTPTVTLANQGASTPVPLIQPYLAVNYCIATAGLFPPRN